MKVTVKLTDLELSNMVIGDKGADNLNPITFDLTHTGLPKVPASATSVLMDGNRTIAYVPQVKYAKLERIEEVEEAIQQIQNFIDEKRDHYKLSDACEKLEEAKDLVKEVMAE